LLLLGMLQLHLLPKQPILPELLPAAEAPAPMLPKHLLVLLMARH
jgi:hypothetical protein